MPAPHRPRFGPVQGLRVRRAALPSCHVTSVRGWRCTTATRAALDIARWESLPEAVAALDILLRVAIEYDGAWHAEDGQFVRDRRRLNRLTAAGWSVLHVTAADLRDPVGLVVRVRALLRDATTGK